MKVKVAKEKHRTQLQIFELVVFRILALRQPAKTNEFEIHNLRARDRERNKKREKERTIEKRKRERDRETEWVRGADYRTICKADFPN